MKRLFGSLVIVAMVLAVGAGTVYGDRTGLVKVVGERKYGELLGGHIVGTRATELIQELVNIRALEGGFPELARIIHRPADPPAVTHLPFRLKMRRYADNGWFAMRSKIRS